MFIYILGTWKVVLVCPLVDMMQPAVVSVTHLVCYAAVLDCFPHFCFLGTGHALFNFQSAVQGHGKHADDICGMSRMN